MKHILTAAFVAIGGVLCAGMALAADAADDLMIEQIGDELTLELVGFDPVLPMFDGPTDCVDALPIGAAAFQADHRLSVLSSLNRSNASAISAPAGSALRSTVPIPLRI